MITKLMKLSAMVILIMLPNPAICEETVEGTVKETVMNFVHDAVEFAQKNGKQALLDEISKGKDGKFMKGELYLSAYDFNVIVLAHAAKPHLKGKDFSKLRDKNKLLIGKAYMDAIAQGGGWIEYYWQNPVTKKVQKKLGYGAKVNETCWVSAGAYVKE